MSHSVDLVQGTLDFLVLKTLTWGPMHGFEISRWIRRITDEALEIEEGALYPALHRMERRGWLQAEWAMTEKNRRAKYYELTKPGRDQLLAEDAEWRRYVGVVGKILAAAKT
jgi:PadR family transcriptional regulator